MRNYTRREFVNLLKDNGYYQLKGQGKGDHDIYYNGINRISVPGARKQMSKGVSRQLINKYNLIIKK